MSDMLRFCRPRLRTLRARILLTFLVMAAISGGLGIFAVESIGRAGNLTAEIFDHALQSISYARAAANDFAQIEALSEHQRHAPSPGADPAVARRLAELSAALDSDLSIAGERSQSPRAMATVSQIREAVAGCRDTLTAIAPGPLAASARQALDDCVADVNEQLDVLVNLTAGQGFHDRQGALDQIAWGRRLSVIGTGGVVAIAVLLTLLLMRQLIGPVASASLAADRIAHGELDTPIPRGADDELGVLLSAMAIMRDNIRDRMAEEVSQRRSAQTRLVDAVESSREGVILVDPQGLIAIANSQSRQFLPGCLDALQTGEPFAALIGAALDSGAMAIEDGGVAALIQQQDRPAPFIGEARLADGRWLRISRSPTRDGGFVAISSDITTLKQRERELRESKLCLDAALDNMSQGLCLFDAQEQLRVVNRRFCEIYGLKPEQVAFGTGFAQIVAASAAAGNHPDQDPERLHRDLRGYVASRASGVQMQELSRERVVGIAHRQLEDGGFVATYEDITERLRAEEQINFLKRHDALTRLPNRTLLIERMEQTLGPGGRGEAFAVLCLDLDRFKAVNDTLGHPVGDRLLVALSERLGHCARKVDTVARLGGDEFAVMLTGLGRPDEASFLARRIIKSISAPYELDGHRVEIGTSIGIAVAPADGHSADILLKNAGIALSRAKADCRGTFRFFESGMDERMQTRRSLEMALRSALAENQLQVFYQPQVDLNLGRLSGFEALLRWRHPERGMVSPGEFIPLAEELGLIIEIGEWTLRAACMEARKWPAHVKVAVNVSPLQITSPRMVSMVAEALAASGLPASRLELEITESTLLVDSSAILTTLRALHGLGVRIAMDDFGTGYSSLSYLRTFPFDKIKIDQSFVRDLADKEDCRAVVRAVVGLGRDLRMRVTAEGVETLAQLAQLRSEGVDELQGYLFGKPQPASELPCMLLRLQHGAEDFGQPEPLVTQAA